MSVNNVDVSVHASFYHRAFLSYPKLPGLELTSTQLKSISNSLPYCLVLSQQCSNCNILVDTAPKSLKSSMTCIEFWNSPLASWLLIVSITFKL